MVNYNDLPTFKHKKEVDKYVYYESEDRYLEIEKIRKSRCRVPSLFHNHPQTFNAPIYQIN